MTEIALSNGHGRPLSMTAVAIRRRASRAGIPVSVYREMGAGHVPRETLRDGHKVTPGKSRGPSQDIRLATSRDPSCDVSRDRETLSQSVTRKEDQRLRL